jgi:hypothetical protein
MSFIFKLIIIYSLIIPIINCYKNNFLIISYNNPNNKNNTIINNNNNNNNTGKGLIR